MFINALTNRFSVSFIVLICKIYKKSHKKSTTKTSVPRNWLVAKLCKLPKLFLLFFFFLLNYFFMYLFSLWIRQKTNNCLHNYMNDLLCAHVRVCVCVLFFLCLWFLCVCTFAIFVCVCYFVCMLHFVFLYLYFVCYYFCGFFFLFVFFLSVCFCVFSDAPQLLQDYFSCNWQKKSKWKKQK